MKLLISKRAQVAFLGLFIMRTSSYTAGFFVFFSLFFLNFLVAAPEVTSVSPVSGNVSGGNVVTISGSGFTGASAVMFGTVPATSFVVNSATSISALVPIGVPGTVDVTVINSSLTSPTSRSDFYTYTETKWKGILSGISPSAITLFDTSTDTISNVISLPYDSLSSIITPDGKTIYAANSNDASVSVIDAATNAIIGTIATSVAGTGAFDIIVSPDGKRVYISNNASGYVTAIDTATSAVVANVFVSTNLGPLSITPDGTTVYVSDFSFGSVTPMNTTTFLLGSSFLTGAIPGMISITPDGTKAYVANLGSDTVSVVSLPGNIVTTTIPFPAGSGPYGSSILANGKTMYVANVNNGTVVLVDVATNAIIPPTISIPSTSPTEPRPFWVASTPDSKTVYVINEGDDNVIAIDVATNTASSPFAYIAGEMQDIVLSADPAPVATFSTSIQPSGSPTVFDAGASLSPIGSIVSYAWDFGDGTNVVTASSMVSHTYLLSGVYNVVLTVTNSAGTSTSKVFSSRFMSNNGGPDATTTSTITIAPFPPSHLEGYQKSCRFLAQRDLINVIEWEPPAVGESPIEYRIYRDPSLTDLIATIPASGPLEFEDHNRRKKVKYTYYIVSVGGSGVISAPVVITIKPKK